MTTRSPCPPRPSSRSRTPAGGNSASSAGGVELPTRREWLAATLRRSQGLGDAEVGRLLDVRRETACRLRAAYGRKLAALADWNPAAAAELERAGPPVE